MVLSESSSHLQLAVLITRIEERELTLFGALSHSDRFSPSHPPMPQIVFYQSGLGTQDNIISQLVDGMYPLTVSLTQVNQLPSPSRCFWRPSR